MGTSGDDRDPYAWLRRLGVAELVESVAYWREALEAHGGQA
jgi:hypothetical protein